MKSFLRLPVRLLPFLVAAACSDAPAPTALSPASVEDPSLASIALRAPAKPISVSATAGNAQAVITWVPFGKAGNAVYYTVRSQPATVSLRVNAPLTTATMTGLTNGRSYTFTVTTTNWAGTSPQSPFSNAVIPTTPTPPPPPPPPPSGSRWISAYYPGYQKWIYPESAVNFAYLTHLVVGRVVPTASGGLITTFDIDPVSGPAMARDLSTRAHAAGRKAILMVGGAGAYSGFVGAASSANRARFITTLLSTMDSYGYDGLDIDWEPINTSDQPSVLALLQGLRAARPGVILTIPVTWVSSNFPGSVTNWYAQVAAAVDQVNIMSYGMADAWPGWTTWHSSALQDEASNRPSSVRSSLRAFTQVGVPASKLGAGIGFYGTCWRGATGPRQTVSGTSVIANDNVMSYTNIMSSYYSSAAYRWDAAASVPYLTFASPSGPQGCNFVSYEDAQSLAAKGAYIKANGFGGAIVWTMNQGYLPNAPAGQRDPLLQAAYNSIVP